MTELAKPHNHLPLEDSIPEVGVPLESILYTEELHRCTSRPPDHKKENSALVGSGKGASRFATDHSSDTCGDNLGYHAI